MFNNPSLLMLSMQKRLKEIGFEEIPGSENQYEIQEGRMWQRLSSNEDFYVYANFMKIPNVPLCLRISATAPFFSLLNERQKKYLIREQFTDSTFSILWQELESKERQKEIFPEVPENELPDMIIFLRMNVELYTDPRDEMSNDVLNTYFMETERRMIEIKENLRKRTTMPVPGQVIRRLPKSEKQKKGIAMIKEAMGSK